MSDEDAAKQWVDEHRDVWQAWMPSSDLTRPAT
jgi:ABC-type proline/glycine betaine transport system substrate-binding protein